MNQFEDMRIFATAVETRSFTAAADKLGLSKQFVSRRVMALEARLGVRLLVRTTRKLTVTELGRVYFERIATILNDVAETEQAITSQNAGPRGSLRISAPMSFGTLQMGPVIAAFLTRYPEVSIELDLNDRTVDLVGEGYDMAVRIGVLGDSSLIARLIAPLHLAAVCSPAYVREHGAPLLPADLKEHDCLLYGHGKNVEWPFKVQGRAKPQAVTGRLRVNNGELARDAALAGLGIALLPTFICGAALRSGALVQVLDDYLPLEGGIYAIYPQHRQSSAAVRAFVDFLHASLAPHGAQGLDTK
jgi:DNA-binding transcriptional LysR family regulator